VLCANLWLSPFDHTSQILAVTSFDLQTDEQLIQEIEAGYEFIHQKLITSGFESLTGRDGKWMQNRTKGGKGSTSRAFYARPQLVARLFADAV